MELDQRAPHAASDGGHLPRTPHVSHAFHRLDPHSPRI
ncbi:hypothetical protein DB31_3717 [Hyalangium minutum]|uniref:Uncharacterized protein n=1 Tax=Hyalangium minutum TaxID=394096 RepID=A0A085WV74_9BACT|nr:hypothetical protein DB31_3717 [Hyalangium minutum]